MVRGTAEDGCTGAEHPSLPDEVDFVARLREEK